MDRPGGLVRLLTRQPTPGSVIDGWRSKMFDRRKFIWSAIAMTSAGVCGSCINHFYPQGPQNVPAGDVPGVYVLKVDKYEDRLELLSDGTFARMSTYQEETMKQRGNWRAATGVGASGKGETWLTFSNLEPACLGDPGASSLSSGPSPGSDLCASRRDYPVDAFFCYDHGRMAVCFREDMSFRFRKQ